jgi:hypothetical protein
MALLLGILVLEVSPMMTLVRWRFASVSYVQTVLVLLMVLAATAMARGTGTS